MIVCGLRPAGVGRNLEIYKILKEDSLQELTEMMVSRICTLMLEKMKGAERQDAPP